MRIYLAGSLGNLQANITAIRRSGPDTPILKSFAYKIERQIVEARASSDVMMDSGAFTFISSGRAIDFDSYASDYAAFVKANGIRRYIELDVDKLIGYGRVKAIRDELEREVGVPPIPVWHRHLGTREFSAMAERYPYVALGGIAIRAIKPREYRAFPWFIREAHRYGAKIHGLGFTNLKLLPVCHFDSVDSSAVTVGVRSGTLWRFDGQTMIHVKRPAGTKLSDYKAAYIHDFCEWAKFSRYARDHL